MTPASSTDSFPYGFSGRRNRALLVALLVLAVLMAAGGLFIKYQLETLRERVQMRLAARMGARFDLSGVQVNGLRGLRIDDLSMTLDMPVGPELLLRAPRVYVYIDWIDLLYGQMTIHRIQADGAQFLISRDADGVWLDPAGARETFGGEFGGDAAFRVVGRGCRLEIHNIVGDTSFVLEDLNLDIARLADSDDISARIAGFLGGDEQKRIDTHLRYASLQDFDLRCNAATLTANDVNVFLPASRHFVSTGVAHPSLRVAGYPNNTMMVSLEADFEAVTLRDQPELFAPATGEITALASYAVDTHLLTLTTARARTGQLSGRLEGSVSFAEARPVFDLRLEADHAPVVDVLDYVLADRKDQYGELLVSIGDAYQIGLALQGTTEDPVLRASAAVNAGSVSFRPKNTRLPAANLAFGMLTVSWDSTQTLPQGALNVSGGSITDPNSGLEARDVTGTLLLREGVLALDPANAAINGNAFTGRAQYDLGTGKGEFSASGVLSEVEKTPLGSQIKNFSLSGTVNARCTGTVTADKIHVAAMLDATQAQIDFDWWLRKPIGIGATVQSLDIDIELGKAIAIAGKGTIDTSQLEASFSMLHLDKRWALDHVHFVLDPIDTGSAGKCLRIPYAISGGTGTGGYVDWKRVPDIPKGKIIRIGGQLDQVSLLPQGGAMPLAAKNARIEIVMDDSTAEPKGTVSIQAEEAQVPPLGTRWLLPLRPEPDPDPDSPEHRRAWTYALSAGALSMPPWQGVNFTGEAFSHKKESGLHRFAAQVDGGGIEGHYHFESVDNVAELQAQWTDIPAVYLIRHLKLPELLDGVITGMIHYTIDYDDPGTLQGAGSFNIREGRFSADFLAEHFKGQLQGDLATLPSSLAFSRFSADVGLDGDVVGVQNLLLRLEGISVKGEGQFVTDGDMDFRMQASIAPATARRIPALLRSFNIDGHRLTQSNIELAFDISGPTFKPVGEVTGLPSIGVTLLSGAGEMASEAIRIIDTPRQILIDLFKIFGGIVGTGK